MDLNQKISQPFALEMATEDDYRRRAENYRSSAEYNKMIGLYPILQSSIIDCQDEKLVAWNHHLKQKYLTNLIRNLYILREIKLP